MSKLDEIDMKILSILFRDSSISVPRLSKELGLNLSVTYSRIKRLRRRGVIERFTVIVNEEKLGLPFSAIAGINIDPKQREQILQEISKLDSVRLIREVTGRFALLVSLRGRTVDDLHRIAYDVIGKIQGVTNVELFMEVGRKIPEVNFRIFD